jgi:NAD(P)-dependent dehydrogenase (short-subunit alcohol dehydrogenase family)
VRNQWLSHQPRTLVPLIEVDARVWDQMLAINLRGVFFRVKLAARAMLQYGGGSIINIASIAGLSGSPYLGPYGAAKAGEIQLTQTAALELAKQNIRVNAVCLSWIETPILGDFERERLVWQIPMRRIGQPCEVAGMVVYLASDVSSFTTGSVLRVDSGIRS